MDQFNSFNGANLTHDQCWELYEEMIKHDLDYEIFESGCTKIQRLAAVSTSIAHDYLESKKGIADFYSCYHWLNPNVFTNLDAAFEQMSIDSAAQTRRDNGEMYWPLFSPEEQDAANEDYFQHHHVNQNTTLPAWKKATDKITELLNQSPLDHN